MGFFFSNSILLFLLLLGLPDAAHGIQQQQQPQQQQPQDQPLDNNSNNNDKDDELRAPLSFLSPDSGLFWMQETWRNNVIYFDEENNNNNNNNDNNNDNNKERFVRARARARARGLQTGDGISGGSKSTAGECIPKDYFDDLIFDDDDAAAAYNDDTTNIDPTCTGCEQVNTALFLTQLDTFVIAVNMDTNTTDTATTTNGTTTVSAPVVVVAANGTEEDYLTLFQELLDTVEISVTYGCNSRCEACFEDKCGIFRYEEYIYVESTPGQGTNFTVAEVQALDKSSMEIAFQKGIYSTTSCAVFTSGLAPGSEACVTLSQIGLEGILRDTNDTNLTVENTTCSISFNGQDCTSCTLDPICECCILADCTNVEPGSTDMIDTCSYNATGMDGYFWALNAFLYNFTPGPGCDSPSAMPSAMPTTTGYVASTAPTVMNTTTLMPTAAPLSATPAATTSGSGGSIRTGLLLLLLLLGTTTLSLALGLFL